MDDPLFHGIAIFQTPFHLSPVGLNVSWAHTKYIFIFFPNVFWSLWRKIAMWTRKCKNCNKREIRGIILMPSKVNDCSGSKAPSFLCSPSLMDWWHTGAPPDRSPWYAFISGNYIISSSSSSYSRSAVGYVSLPLGFLGNLGIYVQFALDRTKPRTAAASRQC